MGGEATTVIYALILAVGLMACGGDGRDDGTDRESEDSRRESEQSGPKVVTQIPAAGDGQAHFGRAIEVGFSKPLDPQTLGRRTVVLRDDRGVKVAIEPHLSMDGKRLRIQRLEALRPPVALRLELSDEISDLVGRSLGEQSWGWFYPQWLTDGGPIDVGAADVSDGDPTRRCMVGVDAQARLLVGLNGGEGPMAGLWRWSSGHWRLVDEMPSASPSALGIHDPALMGRAWIDDAQDVVFRQWVDGQWLGRRQPLVDNPDQRVEAFALAGLESHENQDSQESQRFALAWQVVGDDGRRRLHAGWWHGEAGLTGVGEALELADEGPGCNDPEPALRLAVGGSDRLWIAHKSCADGDDGSWQLSRWRDPNWETRGALPDELPGDIFDGAGAEEGDPSGGDAEFRLADLAMSADGQALAIGTVRQSSQHRLWVFYFDGLRWRHTAGSQEALLESDRFRYGGLIFLADGRPLIWGDKGSGADTKSAVFVYDNGQWIDKSDGFLPGHRSRICGAGTDEQGLPMVALIEDSGDGDGDGPYLWVKRFNQ